MSNIFIDLPTVANIRNVSTCVTSLNISWDPPNGTTCGNVSYDVSISQPPNAVIAMYTANTFLSITGLNNSLPDVIITVTASNRAGQGDDMMFSVQLPRSVGKCCTYEYISSNIIC